MKNKSIPIDKILPYFFLDIKTLQEMSCFSLQFHVSSIHLWLSIYFLFSWDNYKY